MVSERNIARFCIKAGILPIIDQAELVSMHRKADSNESHFEQAMIDEMVLFFVSPEHCV